MALDSFCCPDCFSKLILKEKKFICSKCGREYKKRGNISILLPSFLSENKIKEDDIYLLDGKDNSWYNNKVWYYFIHLSSHIIRFEREILLKVKGPRVLDLACGNGWASFLVKRKNPHFEVYASDVSFNSLDIQGKQMSEIMDVKPDAFIVCDAEKLPFRDNFFDTVFIIASLHHFSDIGKALAEVKRVLKPGGVFLAVDGMMPKIAQKILGDEDSERTKQFGILERKITYNQWQKFLKVGGMPANSLKLYYDPSYLHGYATNPDEEKLIRKSWIFNAAKEVIYGAFLSKINQSLVKKLGLTHIFPAGIVIEYHK